MQNLKRIRYAVPVLAALALGGCGLFKSSSNDKIQPDDPTRPVASMVASVSTLTAFADTPSTVAPTFRATLYDKDGNQFYGPVVQLDGTNVSTSTPGDNTSTIYSSTGFAYATGQTYTTTVQGHSATSPGAIPQIYINSPVRSTSTSSGTTTTLTYYKQTAGQPMPITWSGGDPSQPVYIFIYGTPDANAARRLFVSDDPLQSVGDPENFGKPIPNTGAYTIPATLTERYVDSSGAIATRTVTTFDDPTTTDTSGRAFTVYVAQRQVNTNSPIRFSIVSSAYVTASVLPKS
jgi:hypothetical protein